MSHRLPRNFLDQPHWAGAGNAREDMSAQESLIRARVSTVYPNPPPGADILFWCEADIGGTYYCKGDTGDKPTRAIEWFFTNLARHLGIATPDAIIIESRDGSKTYFGSLDAGSLSDQAHLDRFLRTKATGGLGVLQSWPASYFSGLYVFDLFAGNWDRGRQNFRLIREGRGARLLAFDFASSSIAGLSGRNFPVANGQTVSVGRFLREQHGFSAQSATEMADRIAATPAEIVEGILSEMPDDWLSQDRRVEICELWSMRRIELRLAALRAGLKDASLL